MKKISLISMILVFATGCLVSDSQDAISYAKRHFDTCDNFELINQNRFSDKFELYEISMDCVDSSNTKHTRSVTIKCLYSVFDDTTCYENN